MQAMCTCGRVYFKDIIKKTNLAGWSAATGAGYMLEEIGVLACNTKSYTRTYTLAMSEPMIDVSDIQKLQLGGPSHQADNTH